MLTTAAGAGVGSPRSERRAPSGRARGDGAGGVGRARPTGRQGGDEVRKRSWVWRLAAVVAALALALGLAACGDDDDRRPTPPTVRRRRHHPRCGLCDHRSSTRTASPSTSFAKEVNATGQLTDQDRSRPTRRPRSSCWPTSAAASSRWRRSRARSGTPAGITAFQALQAPFLITNYPLSRGGRGRRHRQVDDRRRPRARPATRGPRDPRGRPAQAVRRQAAREPRPTARARRSAPRSRRCWRPASRRSAPNVEPLPLPDVYQALQNGTVDGVEANLPLIYTQKWYEVAKNVTGNVNFWPFPTVLVDQQGGLRRR